MSKKLTTGDFIIKSRKIHGNKYDYSKVNYVDIKTKVIITCLIHGDFQQTPGSHINQKSGCKKCGRQSQTQKRKLGLEKFIIESRKIHGNRYDYSKVDYVNGRTNVVIICKEHGEFYPRPSNHISRKSGCPKCSIIEQHEKQKKTLREFIKDSIQVHGDRYDYSESKYVSKKEKITVICKEHGRFYPTPNNHTKQGNPSGCPKCGFLLSIEKQIKPLETFIKECNDVHGDLYNYSNVNYTRSDEKVTIICNKHGEFYQSPNSHLRGSGCPECKTEKLTKTLDEFIKDSKEVHGELYNYSKVDYEKGDKKVIIICKKHGEFKQTPRVHLGGGGCQRCSYSKGELEVSNYLKKRKIEYIPQFIFDDLSFERKLRCDFYLNVRNIVIEFNGEQHYKSNSFFGGEEGLKKVQESDKLKEDYCKKNNIGFEVIRFDEDVTERLNKILGL